MASPLSVTSQNVTSAPLTPFGMLGGLVPVTVPFQFPLELLGFGTDTAGATTTSGSTSAAFHHSLTQNLLKGLQPGAQHAATLSHSPLPAHLQQAYTDGGQSKGDTKLQRKNQWLLDKQGSWSSSGWLTESAQLGKCLLSQGCCFCRCLHILILSTVVRGRRKIKQYLIKERRKRRTGPPGHADWS